jgi:hypothetical protein
VVWTATLVAVQLVPGVLGVLSRWSVLVLALALAGVVAARLPAQRSAAPGPRGFEAASGGVSWALALGGAGLLGLWSLTAMWTQWAVPSVGLDTLTHHLPNVVSWIHTGSFWQVDQFVPFLANGNYPHNGDVLFMTTVLPWHNDAFVRPWNFAWFGLTALAVYAIAAELRAPRAAAVLFAATFCSIPIFLLTVSSGAMTDTPLLAMLAAGVLFLVRHARGQQTGDLVLAGVALGLAFGTKWYGVSSVVVVVAVWAGASLAARRSVAAVARQAAALGGLVLAAGGFWFVRNWVESGNPVYPLSVGPFHAPVDVIRERIGFTIADYLTDWGVLSDWIFPAWRTALNLPAAAIGAAALVGLAVALRDRERPAVPIGLAVCALLLAVAYAFTPDTAIGPPGRPQIVAQNSRYLLPALLVAAPVAAWMAGRLGRARIALELVAFAGIVQGIRRGFTLERTQVMKVALGLALLAGIAYAVRRLAPDTNLRGRTAAALAAVLAVVALTGAGWTRQKHFTDDRYAQTGEPALDWFATHPGEHRVALQGKWPVSTISPILPAFGPELRNEVQYAGPTVDGQLRDYGTADEFARAFRRGRFELLLVSRRTAGAEVPGDRFAGALGLQPLVAGKWFRLYRLPGPSG